MERAWECSSSGVVLARYMNGEGSVHDVKLDRPPFLFCFMMELSLSLSLCPLHWRTGESFRVSWRGRSLNLKFIFLSHHPRKAVTSIHSFSRRQGSVDDVKTLMHRHFPSLPVLEGALSISLSVSIALADRGKFYELVGEEGV